MEDFAGNIAVVTGGGSGSRQVPAVPRAPGFQAEAHRQALLLRGAPEEAEALDFIEAAANTGDDET